MSERVTGTRRELTEDKKIGLGATEELAHSLELDFLCWVGYPLI